MKGNQKTFNCVISLPIQQLDHALRKSVQVRMCMLLRCDAKLRKE